MFPIAALCCIVTWGSILFYNLDLYHSYYFSHFLGNILDNDSMWEPTQSAFSRTFVQQRARSDCDPINWPQANSSPYLVSSQFGKLRRTRPHPYLAHYTFCTAGIIAAGLCHNSCFPQPIEFQVATGVSMIFLSELTLFRMRIYLITNIGHCMKTIWYWLHPDNSHINFEDGRWRDNDRWT